jgi:multicomponent Na+:H+ antiporter subunit G
VSVRTVVAGTLLATGTLLIAVTALGMVRLPDVYNRMNAVAKAASLGLSCVLFGVLLVRPGVRAAVVVGLAVLLQLLTAPVGSYALASAAYRAGVRLAPATRDDALARLRGRDGCVGDRCDGVHCCRAPDPPAP